jgi:hypothetical protein
MKRQIETEHRSLLPQVDGSVELFRQRGLAARRRDSVKKDWKKSRTALTALWLH